MRCIKLIEQRRISMSKNIIYIIGDGFCSLNQLENVFTVSQIIKILNAEESFKTHLAVCVIGQGVSKKEREQLESYSRQNKLGLIINAHQIPTSSELTHKHKCQNIMITEPLTVIPGKKYCAYLSTDDACAEMSDHLTGHHIQGMVLTEAARQMMLAVAEKYMLDSAEKGNSYCILTEISSSFLQFAFPVEIKIEHEILEFNQLKSNGYEAKTRTIFIQNSTVIGA